MNTHNKEHLNVNMQPQRIEASISDNVREEIKV
jgi:hypothetical protein